MISEASNSGHGSHQHRPARCRRGHIAQRAMKAHVCHAMATGARCRQRAELVDHMAGQLVRVDLHRPAAEAPRSGKPTCAPMSTPRAWRQAHRAVHDDRVAGMEAAGHVGGRDEFSRASSSPMRQGPKPSPRSAFRSMSMLQLLMTIRCSSSGRAPADGGCPATQPCADLPSLRQFTGSSSGPTCSRPQGLRRGCPCRVTPARAWPGCGQQNAHRRSVHGLASAGAARENRAGAPVAFAHPRGGCARAGPVPAAPANRCRWPPAIRPAGDVLCVAHVHILSRPSAADRHQRPPRPASLHFAQRGDGFVPSGLDEAHTAADRLPGRAATDRPR
jgi:hypothetical protein